ncbi:hypothetical protein BDU57DRAFT_437599 [Ampelomyces quisqualis]|uniref:Uncharacterized protein n=1 Tax=Ampelomyces quisqualis TaxID=50730 RepID=A0A6A5QZ80_AMPQU|nr:hypothetical protein BDU57DRAFT_437599 [Ampelomyces quisqualis]
MRPSLALVGALLAVAPAVLSQDSGLPNLASLSAPDGQGAHASQTSAAPQSTNAPSSTGGATPTTNEAFPTVAKPGGIQLSGLPTLAGVGVPEPKIPDTAGAAFMQKSDLPDGTVFICVGAILAFLAAAVLAWRGLVAWSLHRSVKRAAMAQNMADMKAMSAVPGKKRGMYNVVGANSTMSLDHLSAAPIGNSKTTKPFAQAPGGTPPGKSASSLFFSPTAGGTTGLRDSVNRSSNYLPAGYYAAGNAAPAQGSPVTHIGGHQNLSANSLATPGNRFSHRSGISPPDSPSLPPSRGGNPRAPPSRDSLSMFNRNSVATLGTPRDTRSGVYSHASNDEMSQLSLNVPGGTTVAGGRAPSAYLEDLFENHGSGPRERF